LDLSTGGGHVAIIGGPQSGKTTLLRTLVAGLALTHSPDQVAIYGLDLAGGGLAALRGFPQVGGIASRTDPDALRRTIEELRAALDHREQVFRDRAVDSVDQLRLRHSAGEIPDLPSAEIVLVIDGAHALRNEQEAFDEPIADLLTRGPTYGIHVVATVLRWNDLRMAVQPAYGTRIELRLNDPSDSIINRKLAATLPARRPGRALLNGDSGPLIAQTALPRTDGSHATDSVTDAMTALAAEVARAWPGRRAPAVRVLPAVVEVSALPDAIDEPHAVPIGISERTLEPVLLDLFGRDQHLLVFGDTESGKSSLLRGIATGLLERYADTEVVLAVFDPRLSLTDLVPDSYLGGHATNTRLAAGLAASICKELETRLPETQPGFSSHGWEGPRIVVLVDDYDVLSAAGQSPLEAFTPYLPAARDIGLHVVITRPVAGAARGLWDPVISLVRDAGAVGLVLSGDRSEGQLLPNVYASAQPAGRGQLVRRGRAPQLVQLARFASSAARRSTS
jgi:S-DNA-T family DNA segregation ATPase FtsK/SpoIIIE